MLHLTQNINPSQEAINEYVDLGGGLVAHRYGILTTSYVAYEVYRQTELSAHEYSTITHEPAYGWLGDITTKRLPAELDALPAWSKERSDAVGVYLDSLKRRAEALIRQAFPHDFPPRETLVGESLASLLGIEEQATPAPITIRPVCGHPYTVPADTDASEVADLKTQMCASCVTEMIAFEQACEEEYQEQQERNHNELLPNVLRQQLPPLYSQEHEKDPMVYAKFFHPLSNFTWYATEGSPEGDDFIFFGWVHSDFPELGYFSLSEMQGVHVQGLGVERDEHFTPMRLSDVKKLHAE